VVISTEPVSCADIVQRFPQFFVDSVGDLQARVHAIQAPESATPGSMIFLANPKALAKGLQSQASALVVSRKSRAEAEAQRGDRTLLIANNVELAMASVISAFFLPTPYTNRSVTTGIHPSAVIHPSATLAPNVRVGPHAFIGADVVIGSGSYIGANSVIEDQSVIGEETVIHPLVFIGHSTQIGNRCEVHPQTVIAKEGFGYAHDERGNHYRIPHQGRVVLEDDVHIGASCSLDRATFGETRIEAGTKTDNQIHIAHNCRIGRNNLLVAGFAIAGSSRTGANVVAGGSTSVTGHIEICDNVQLAGVSAVSKSISKPGQYGGNPLVPLQDYIKIKVFLTKLPEMAKQVKAITKKLGLDQSEESSNET
jgi:UDP-3-O-[3-hydroxymyristoyl] glucosamine N-acyltransferase